MSADVSYGIPISTPGLGLRAFLGYGSFSVTPTTVRWTSSGFRVGVEADYPLLRTAAGQNVNLALSLAWHPSNTVSPSGLRGTVLETMVATEFKIPWMRTAPLRQADYDLASLVTAFDPNWSGRAGWKTLGATGSSFQWSGPFFELFKTF